MKGSGVWYGGRIFWGNSDVEVNASILMSYRAYASIELCRLVADQGVEMVEWTMATTSDAKGWLPMWVQKLGIPGAISKDVAYFMNWVAGRRRKQDPEYSRWCGDSITKT